MRGGRATEVHVLTLAVGVVEEQWLAGILPMDN